MAQFTVREVEGMRQVRIDLQDEAIRTRRGALSNLRGRIRVTARLPGMGDLVRGALTDEARVRPEYSGTGAILLQPSLGGYHVMELTGGDRWVLEPGVFWASESTVSLGLHRERMWPSFWAGDGFLAWKTTVAGQGLVAINAPGPVEVVEVEDNEIRVQGRLVLGRTDGLSFSMKRASTLLRSPLVGQKLLRVLTGTGKALVCWTPYWNQHIYQRMTGETIRASLFE
ncbi:AIM24 family protein [Rubellimicrobium arenae]|uniref:AIM24 family protein n=1 Tax=Rubellimicrobium arenae TaxID=2817372 RepID=UPI001B315B91|nr:AIM24 family protein [Rubellimicrobium arenae]